MKKLLCLLLALTMLFAFAACKDTEDDAKTDDTAKATEPSEPAVVIGSALEILENVWATYGEEEKFFSMGGGYANMTDGVPGMVNLDDIDSLDGLLVIPEAEIAKLDDAASLIHAMNANTFTCGAFHLTDAAQVTAFTDAVKAHIAARQWMCGIPETLLMVQVGEDYVVSAFGAADIMETFKTKLLSVYETATILVEEPIA